MPTEPGLYPGNQFHGHSQLGHSLTNEAVTNPRGTQDKCGHCRTRITDFRAFTATHQNTQSDALFADVRLQLVCSAPYQFREIIASDAFRARESSVPSRSNSVPAATVAHRTRTDHARHDPNLTQGSPWTHRNLRTGKSTHARRLRSLCATESPSPHRLRVTVFAFQETQLVSCYQHFYISDR
jgi:hypothetical protein